MTKILKGVVFKAVSAEGLVEAVIATLGVKDKDGDVTMPGFFGTQEVVMLPTHDWNSIPLGKGVLSEEGSQAIARIQMNLDIPKAKDWHSALKFDLENGKPSQQWSYGFNILDGGSEDGMRDGESVRFLKPINGQPGCKCWEVSPVLVGAGEGTMTRSVKSATEEKRIDVTENTIRVMMRDMGMFMSDSMRTVMISEDQGIRAVMGKLKKPMEGHEDDMMLQSYIFDRDKWTPEEAEKWAEAHQKSSVMDAYTTFSDEAAAVLAAAKALAARGRSLADLRAKEGRSVSAANRERLASVACSLKDAVAELAVLSAPVENDGPYKEYLRYLRLQSGV